MGWSPYPLGLTPILIMWTNPIMSQIKRLSWVKRVKTRNRFLDVARICKKINPTRSPNMIRFLILNQLTQESRLAHTQFHHLCPNWKLKYSLQSFCCLSMRFFSKMFESCLLNLNIFLLYFESVNCKDLNVDKKK